MNAVELEKMVVRLLGDGSAYVNMLQTSAAQTERTAVQVEAASRRIENISSSIKGFATAAVTALASFGLATSLTGTFEKFDELEKINIRLKASIEASGQEVDSTLKKYKVLTKEIMDNSLATKGEITGLIQKSLNMNKSGEAMERMVKNSIAFGAVTGQGAEAGFELAKSLEMGNTMMLKHMLLGRGAKVTDEELTVIIKQRLAAGFKIAGEEMNTVGGRIEKLQRGLKELNIEIGGMVSEAISPFIGILTNLMGSFKVLEPETKKMIAMVLLGTLAFIGLGPAITTAGFLMDALGVSFALSTAAQIAGLTWTAVQWMVWTAAVHTANAAVWLWNLGISIFTGGMWLLNAAIGTATISSIFWGTINAVTTAGLWIKIAAIAVGTAAVWAYNASMTAATVVWGFFTTAMAIASMAWAVFNFQTTASSVGMAIWGAVTTAWTYAVAAAQAAWTFITGIATAVSTTYNISVATGIAMLSGWTLASIGAAIAAGFWSAWAIVAKVATWLWNSALTVTNVLLAGIPALIGVVVVAFATFAIGAAAAAIACGAIAVPVGIVAGSVAVLSAGVMALVSTFTSLWTAIAGSDASGPLQAMTPIFMEWWTIIKSIVHAAQVDMPLAWQLTKASGMLAWAQLKALWPPLWAMIGEGFSVLWDLVVEEASSSLKLAPYAMWKAIITTIDKIGDAFAWLWDTVKEGLANALSGGPSIVDKIKSHINASVKEANDGLGEMKTALQKAQERLAEVSAKFKYVETPEVKAAREEVHKINLMVDAKEAEKNANKLGMNTGAAFGKGLNSGAHAEIGKLDAALMGSSEALSRISAYTDMLSKKSIGETKNTRQGQMQSNVNMNAERNDGADANTPVLKDILEEVKKGNKQPDVNLNPANIG